MRNHANNREGAILKGICPFFLQINPVNSLVWRATSNKGEAVFLKAAERKETILKQIEISSAVSSFVPYLPFSDGEWVKESGGLTFACMKAIQGRALNYAYKEDRLLAMEKIAHFHEEVEGMISDSIPTVSLNRKWTNRFLRFKQEIATNVFPLEQEKLICFYLSVGEKVVSEMIEVERLEQTALRHHYIVHGDPAHHNFIFNRDQLRLIDGDLVSYAPREYDYLQMLNRMLPYCDWSLEEWRESHIFSLRQCIENPFLRKLLAYPADFYREWLVNPSGRNELLVKTAQQHSKRAEFIRHVL
ncbi:phosphotransferase [Guptibacillus hwajinpoensis]|uniref:phosphotransferase n=1 Tax=Guptibacillus hwajinpoensis TaxID=208199 RepID=UPI001CFE962C|nr:phosphotransferase [Pseudalkalibacillus hwajinpoensis]